jgi:hypothetical protein
MDKKQWLDAECAKVFSGAKNAALSAELYRVASQESRLRALWPEFELPPSRWYTRLWWRVKAKLPRVHFGPCDHEGCDGY